MKRSILAVIVGLVVWVVVVSLLNRGLRLGLPGYAVAEPAMAFTLGMKVARLIIGALSSLAAGAATGMLARSRTRLPWVLGIIILVAFIPGHIRIWDKFPVWYHLTFLVTLAPLVALGGALTRSRPGHVSVPEAL
ncbi:MAG TPA: hypothetical protein VEE87_00310 [archaeon]|nr:hypothetical protein [archaeon]